MAVLKKDEFFERIKQRVGDDSSDEAISFFEDITDTYNELEQRKSTDGVDWEKKYYENDEAWKRRYKNRFFNGTSGNMGGCDSEPEKDEEYDPESITIDKLFNKED